MTARELFDYFRNRAHWVSPESTADGIRYGNADTQVIKAGTGWIDCVDNLAAAAADGCNVFISHEVPFSWETGGDLTQLTWYRRRLEILEASGMVLMNLHDTWDHFPRIGIRDGFAQLLGLTQLVREIDYIHPHTTQVSTGGNSIGIYRIAPTTAGDFARYMCDRIAAVDAPGLCFNGDVSRLIETVAIGVGCHVPSLDAVNAGAQLLVDVYDRHLQQTSRIPLADSGVPVITVEHSVAETYAMKLMADFIREELGLEACYYHREPLGIYYTPQSE